PFASALAGAVHKKILRTEFRVRNRGGGTVLIKNRSKLRISLVARTALLSVSYLALATASSIDARAQSSSPAQQAPEAQPNTPSSSPPAPPQQAPTTQSDPTPAPSGQQPPAAEPGEAPLPPVTVLPPRQKPQSKTTEGSQQSSVQPTARRPARPTNATPVAMSPIAVQAA